MKEQKALDAANREEPKNQHTVKHCRAAVRNAKADLRKAAEGRWEKY